MRYNNRLVSIMALIIFSGAIITFLEYHIYLTNLKLLQLNKFVKKNIQTEIEKCQTNKNFNTDDNSSKLI